MKVEFLRNVSIKLKGAERIHFEAGFHDVDNEIVRHPYFESLVDAKIAIPFGDSSASSKEAKEKAENKAQKRKSKVEQALESAKDVIEDKQVEA